MSLKFLVLDTYYSAFLQTLYERKPGLEDSLYAEQWRSLMDQCFGTADFYSSNLIELGHEATEIVVNCEPLQRQWAREHDVQLPQTKRGRRGRPWSFLARWPKRDPARSWWWEVLEAQICQYGPDVLHVQDMNGMPVSFLRRIRPHVRLITGQIACPIGPRADFSEYDLVLSSFPHFVERFREDGLSSEYFNLGFEPRILERLQRPKACYDVSFVGTLSRSHRERVRFLEQVSASHRLDVWGPGIDALEPTSPLHGLHHGSAWGLDMYQVLHDSELALNHHIDVAQNYANNMRLYEATGVGTLLITDHKQNLRTLFEPGKEVLVYRSAEECAELISYYIEHQEEREAIARAGQKRTLSEHTYLHRMQEFVRLVTSSRRRRTKQRKHQIAESAPPDQMES